MKHIYISLISFCSPTTKMSSSSDSHAGEDDVNMESNNPPPTTATASSSFTSFWCHSCRSTVDLTSPAPPLVCPRCSSEFLEELEAFNQYQRNLRSFIPRVTGIRTFGRPYGDLPFPPLDDDEEDNNEDQELQRFLDGRGSSFAPRPRPPRRNYADVIDRLILNIDDVTNFDNPSRRGSSPTPKASIEAIPTVQITESFLADDPQLLCAVCKDEFFLGSEAKRLPCSHVYHEDCIIPWLTNHNSCPVCRSQLPGSGGSDVAPAGGGGEEEMMLRRRRRLAATRRFLLMDNDAVEALEIGGMLSQIARSSSSMYPARSGSRGFSVVSGFRGVSGVSPTQMAEENVGSVGPANSMETVSSVWHADGGGGGSSRSVAGPGVVARTDEETDVAMSVDRRDVFD